MPCCPPLPRPSPCMSAGPLREFPPASLQPVSNPTPLPLRVLWLHSKPACHAYATLRLISAEASDEVVICPRIKSMGPILHLLFPLGQPVGRRRKPSRALAMSKGPGPAFFFFVSSPPGRWTDAARCLSGPGPAHPSRKWPGSRGNLRLSLALGRARRTLAVCSTLCNPHTKKNARSKTNALDACCRKGPLNPVDVFGCLRHRIPETDGPL